MDSTQTTQEYYKIYYQNNKNHICESSKHYYEKNKDKVKVRHKKYRDTNKTKIQSEAKLKIVCECGITLNKGHLARHRATKKHEHNLNVYVV